MCLYPQLIRNKKYTINKKNQGNIPIMKDKRVMWVPVGCGRCIECMKGKARNWQTRLLEDIKDNRNGKFITLTFSNEAILQLTNEIHAEDTQSKILEGYELDNAIATLAMRKFLERWRKKYHKSLRHWMVTELGHNGTENIHLHGIVFTNESLNTVEEKWKYGHVWKGKLENGKIINYVNEATVNYITKYVNKVDVDHKYYRPKVLTSPGIGSNYIKSYNFKSHTYNNRETIETYRTRSGQKIAMPIYWRNKAFTDNEREQLWLFKLDKQQRWVCGECVDISNGDKDYYNLLRYHRERNNRLGYGNNEKDWNREQYERERRRMLHAERRAFATLRQDLLTSVSGPGDEPRSR